ncbi:hypothetical protein [Myroides fluvii]|uniref:hypothetical protein n=1 Tax=Myroides fluvii TaxID=2572594 RepID=UPI00131B22B8|nr:hypothetical protein [Myroides fluvii]
MSALSIRDASTINHQLSTINHQHCHSPQQKVGIGEKKEEKRKFLNIENFHKKATNKKATNNKIKSFKY